MVMKKKPTLNAQVRTFEVYFVDGRLLGHEIDWKPYPKSMEGFSYQYLLAGKEATFCIVTHDSAVTRQEAIDFCAAVHTGNVRIIKIDLRPYGNDERQC